MRHYILTLGLLFLSLGAVHASRPGIQGFPLRNAKDKL